MTRFIILITLVGYMCINRFLIVILGLILIGLIVIFYQSQKEGFEPFYKLQPYFSLKQEKPVDNNNPFSNVLMTDYKYNVNKEESNEEYTPALEEKILLACALLHLLNNTSISPPKNLKDSKLSIKN